MSDAPIVPQEYFHGVKVVDIGDMRIARGQTRRPKSTCAHNQTVYDSAERRIYCQDCESDVDPFDVVVGLVEYYDAAVKRLKREREELQQAQQFRVISRAAKSMDEAWRRRDMVPRCPQRNTGILPEDVVGKISLIGKKFEIARRAKKDGAV